MSGGDSPSVAQRVADRLRVEGPWEVFAEQAERYEVHLNGTRVELVRGPISLTGYSVRLLRSREGKTATGFQASTDLSEAGIGKAVEQAETVARHTEFPATDVKFPSAPSHAPASAEVLDRALWDDPAGAVEAYLAEMRNSFSGRSGASLSFGSVKTAKVRSSLVNSSGLSATFSHTLAQIEMAVKAHDGPEGAAPGEYWVDESYRRLATRELSRHVDDWCRFAADARKAVAPPSGELPVVLPTGVLSGIVPPVIGFRATGSARLRQLGIEVGQQVAAASVRLTDDGRYPWAPESGPFDAEGTPTGTTTVIDNGVVRGLAYDTLHAAAFSERSTGNSVRSGFGPRGWFSFVAPPVNAATTLVIAPGTGGSDAELCEAAGEGIWVQQLGWANPEPISGAFGGEVRIGYRIRHGKLAEPVRGGIVGGLVVAPPGKPSLLANVAAIGAKPQLADALVSPPLLVRTLTVAGTAK